MQNEKLHLTQAHPDIIQVVLRIGTRKAESGANFTYVVVEDSYEGFSER